MGQNTNTVDFIRLVIEHFTSRTAFRLRILEKRAYSRMCHGYISNLREIYKNLEHLQRINKYFLEIKEVEAE